MTLRALAILSTAFFTGAAVYISLVEHPARMSLASEVAAILSAVCGLLVSMSGGSWMWAIGGLMVGIAVPFTLIVILPTNKRLLADDANEDADVRSVLARWGHLHWVRSAWATGGLVVLILAALAGVRARTSLRSLRIAVADRPPLSSSACRG